METRSLSELPWEKLTNRTHLGSGSRAVMTMEASSVSVYVIDSYDPPDSSLLQIVISVADSEAASLKSA